MDATTEICNFDDLLRSTDTADVDDLEETLLGRVEFHDDDGECEVESSDTQVSVMLIGSGIGGQGFELVYPFTMEQFWHEVDEVDRLNLRRVHRKWLPETLIEEDGTFENDDLMDAIATYLDVDRADLQNVIGGGWHTLDAPAGVNDNPEFSATPVLTEPDLFWIYAGAPLMVALGLGDDWIEVASPTYIPFGGAGPSWVHVDNVAVVDLNDAGALQKMAPAISKATVKSTKRCGICWSCRTLQEKYEDSARFVCRSCMEHDGVIFC